MIAYYESESQHPPANMLADLVRALNVSADALLGIKPVETTPISSRLERRIRQIEKLGPKPRQQITQLIDTFCGDRAVKTESHRQRIIREDTMEQIATLHIEKLPEGVYLATSDDIPGLVAQGRTITETLEIARDVAKKLLEAQAEHHQKTTLKSTKDSFDYPLILGT